MRGFLLILCAACLVSCGGSSDTKDDELNGTLVMANDGAIQCVRNELPPEETAQLLIEAGIDVSQSRCASNTEIGVPAVCGALTDGVHVHQIPPQSLGDAERLGFTRVEDREILEVNECNEHEEYISTEDFAASSYRFTYETTGFSPLQGEWQIEVTEGEVTAVSYLGDDRPEVELTIETAPTIEELLDRIEACKPSSGCWVTELDYDQEDYFPRRFRKSMGEEGDGFRISAFERIQ